MGVKTYYYKGNKQYDTAYKQKEFFSTIYREELGTENNLKDNQYFRILQIKNNYPKQYFFKNLDDLVHFTSDIKNRYSDMYFNLSLTNGKTGKNEDLRTRTVLGFDFDYIDNHEIIIDKFKNVDLWYHALIDSGNGYHAYVIIESTEDYKLVSELNKSMGEQLGADSKALKCSQVLRVPYTFNLKGKPKQVNIVKLFKKKIKPYKLSRLRSQFIETANSSIRTAYDMTGTNIPVCIEKAIRYGTKAGQRYNELTNIVVALRKSGKDLNDIEPIVQEWAKKSNYNDSVMTRTKHIYHNKKYLELNCSKCEDRKGCTVYKKPVFEPEDDSKTVVFTEKVGRSIKPNRKGAKRMNGNQLMIYGVLLNHERGLYRSEIVEEITFENKQRLSDRLLSQTLKELEKNKFIEVEEVGKMNFYKYKEIRTQEEMKFKISIAAIYSCIKGEISSEELELYLYIRYLHNKELRECSRTLGVNEYHANQEQIAKDLNISQQRVSQMIKNLLDKKLISPAYRQKSNNNKWDYNIYTLNY